MLSILFFAACAHHVPSEYDPNSRPYIAGTQCLTIVEVTFGSLPEGVDTVYVSAKSSAAPQWHTINGLIASDTLSNALCFDQAFDMYYPVNIGLVMSYGKDSDKESEWIYLSIGGWQQGTTQTWKFDHALVGKLTEEGNMVMQDYPVDLTVTVTRADPWKPVDLRKSN